MYPFKADVPLLIICIDQILLFGLTSVGKDCLVEGLKRSDFRHIDLSERSIKKFDLVEIESFIKLSMILF